MDKWSCRYGCNQAKNLKKYGRYCVHLERKIGPAGGMAGRYTIGVDARATSGETPESLFSDRETAEQVARATGEEYSDDLLCDEDKFRAILKGKGVGSKKIEVMVKRILGGMSFKEIAILLGYTQPGHAAQAYKDAIIILKKRKVNDQEG